MFLRLGAALAAVSFIPFAAAQQTGTEVPFAPYVIDHPGRSESKIDMRALLPGPAGKDGFITVKNGRFVFPDGRRFRCWGVNLTGWAMGSALLPAHRDAEIYAESLAKLGVNCVRFHFLDMRKSQTRREGEGPTGDRIPVTQTPSGLIDPNFDDSRHFDADQLDRLHYFYAQLKKNGIYIDFNLNVGRRWMKGDNVPDYDLIGVAKGVTHFGPELVEGQKEYARMLLTAMNPYTGMRYVDDPAVAIVEIVNENSMLEFWQRNWLRGELKHGGENHQLDMTEHYGKLLTQKYNAWLSKNRTPAEYVKLRQLSGVAAGQPIPFLRRGDFRAAPVERYNAEIGFITDLEIEFHGEMTRYLRGLGVKSIIMPTADHTYFIAGQPMMRSGAKFDVMDSHVYWQHPAIYGKRNEPMVNFPELAIPTKLARTAMTGKAFTVSEVNHPYPSDYGAEMIPTLASYAALQDWDGIFFYTFEAKVTDKMTPVIGDHFDITQDPVKIAQMPVGAGIFLRGDVSAAKKVATRAYSTEQINESARLPREHQPYFEPGFDTRLPLIHGSRVSCLDCKSVKALVPQVGNPIVSDTNELSWRTDGGTNGLITIDTPRTQGLVGFVRANPKVKTTHLGAEIKNEFASITLTSMDGKPLYQSNSILLTAVGRAQNTGAEWNERRTMLSKWGTAPTLIEPIKGWIMLRDIDGPVGVFVQPLDGAGKPLGEPYRGRMMEAGWEVEIGRVPTTSYLIRIAR